MSIAGWTSLPSPLHQSIQHPLDPGSWRMVESFCPIITGFACTIWRRISIWVRLSRRLRALRRVEIRSWISRERKDVLHTRTARDARGGGERATRGRRGTGKGRGAPRARSGPKASSVAEEHRWIGTSASSERRGEESWSRPRVCLRNTQNVHVTRKTKDEDR